MATEEVPAPCPGERIAELKEQNEQLKARVQELEKEREEAAQAVKGAGGLAARVLLGRRLRASFRAWLEAKSLHDPLPADETADILAAIVRRVIRVGIVGLFVAALPGAFLLWQNVLIREQNAAIQSQIEQQAAQVKQQAAQFEQQVEDTLIVRRAQLLATIYEEECEEDSEIPSTDQLSVAMQQRALAQRCRPEASVRTRREAALAFFKIESGRGHRPDLSKADLSRADFTGADLSRANLGYANLSDASLSGADLSETCLLYADLNQANLFGADLSKADLGGTMRYCLKLWIAAEPGAG